MLATYKELWKLGGPDNLNALHMTEMPCLLPRKIVFKVNNFVLCFFLLKEWIHSVQQDHLNYYIRPLNTGVANSHP